MPDYNDILSAYSVTPRPVDTGVPGSGNDPADEQAKANEPTTPSQMDENTLYVLLKDWFEVDCHHSNEWRRTAREEFDFVANEQWDVNDKRDLEDSGRVPITFNRTLSIIKSVAGIEINGRHETAYLPRSVDTDSAEINEMLTEASNWMADGCDAEDEQSDAFQDCCICGMGWTEQRLDYEEDPEGKYVEERIDPLEMVWDNASRAKNLNDARRIWRVRRMLLSEAKERFPNVHDIDLDASWARQLGIMQQPIKPVEDRIYRDENLQYDYDPKTEVHIVQVQWWEREAYWRVIDPLTPNAKPLDLKPKQFERLKQRYEMLGRGIIALELHRRVYKQAFLGGRILSGVKSAPVKDRFTFQCITGERDRNKGYWFGLVRLMKDPQMWANKWLSQSLHILNTTAKGGILAEEDAFPDQREAEETYAQPDAITWVRKGALAAQKIMQKPGAGMPQGYINLLQFAVSSIRDVVGINLELLGMRDVNQPGILEAQRKQAAMTILATLFDSLRRFRKNVGRVRLFFIQNYLADGRWIRINGSEGRKFVQLRKDKTLGLYDVIVDDAPTSPNQKEKSWAIIQMMLPAIKDLLTPEIILMILEYSPLPSKLINSLKELLQKPDPKKQMAQQLQIASAQAQLQKLQSEAAKNKAMAGKANADALQTQTDAQHFAANSKLRAEQDVVDLQREIAAAHRDYAAAAELRAKTVLELAEAAAAASSDVLNKARSSYLAEDASQRGFYGETGTPEFGGGLLEALNGESSDKYVLPPTNTMLPGVPSLPALGSPIPSTGAPPSQFALGGRSGLPNMPLQFPSPQPPIQNPTVPLS